MAESACRGTRVAPCRADSARPSSKAHQRGKHRPCGRLRTPPLTIWSSCGGGGGSDEEAQDLPLFDQLVDVRSRGVAGPLAHRTGALDRLRRRLARSSSRPRADGMATPLALGRIGVSESLPVGFELDPDAQAPYRRTDPSRSPLRRGWALGSVVRRARRTGRRERALRAYGSTTPHPRREQDSARWCSERLLVPGSAASRVLARRSSRARTTLRVRVHPLSTLRAARSPSDRSDRQEVRRTSRSRSAAILTRRTRRPRASVSACGRRARSGRGDALRRAPDERRGAHPSDLRRPLWRTPDRAGVRPRLRETAPGTRASVGPQYAASVPCRRRPRALCPSTGGRRRRASRAGRALPLRRARSPGLVARDLGLRSRASVLECPSSTRRARSSPMHVVAGTRDCSRKGVERPAVHLRSEPAVLSRPFRQLPRRGRPSPTRLRPTTRVENGRRRALQRFRRGLQDLARGHRSDRGGPRSHAPSHSRRRLQRSAQRIARASFRRRGGRAGRELLAGTDLPVRRQRESTSVRRRRRGGEPAGLLRGRRERTQRDVSIGAGSFGSPRDRAPRAHERRSARPLQPRRRLLRRCTAGPPARQQRRRGLRRRDHDAVQRGLRDELRRQLQRHRRRRSRVLRDLLQSARAMACGVR